MIIADYNLADGLTGVAAIEALRANSLWRSPAFLISADATPERLSELRAAGFQILRKRAIPVMLRALMLSKLDRDVARSSAVGQAFQRDPTFTGGASHVGSREGA